MIGNRRDIMDITTALKKRRSARIFKQLPVEEDKLVNMIDLARLSPSGANLQSLKYIIITKESIRKELFPLIAYAGYIPEWNPAFEETPQAFIAVINDTKIRPTNDATQCDSGIAMMSICLAAYEMGYDSCMLGAIKRKEIAELLKLGEGYDLMYMIGIGVSDVENSSFDSSDEIKYEMDEKKNFKVPKRKIEDVLINKLI